MSADAVVSVVIPTRDRWPLLHRALSTVLGQADVGLEAIVVDDGSTEAIPNDVTDNFNGRVRLVRTERRQGVAEARNRGIAEARGAWVAFLDDDDLWAPTKLRSQLQSCLTEDADLSYTSVVVVDSDLMPQAVNPAPEGDGLTEKLLESNVIGGPSSVLVRRTMLERVGGFDPSLSVLADWDLWIRLSTAGRVAVSPEALTGYVLHDANMHLDLETTLAEFRILQEKHASRARATGSKVGGEGWSRWLAFARRRNGQRRRAAAGYLSVGLRYGNLRDIARSFGVLFGESALAFGRRAPDFTTPQRADDVRWVNRIRDGSTTGERQSEPSGSTAEP